MIKTKNMSARRAQRTRLKSKRRIGVRPRLSVFRSGKHIYAQLINDAEGNTVAAASTIEKELRGSLKNGGTINAAVIIGKLLAERAIANGIKEVVFDRGGYRYHGRVKALAESARESGLAFQELGKMAEKKQNSSDRKQHSFDGRGRTRNNRDRDDDDELLDKLVHINRVAKVIKGGRRFSFGALVVVGDGRGRVGYGMGKAREVPEAIRKATEKAKRNMVRIPLREGRTLHHDIRGRYGAGRVFLRAAPSGTGIIAGGPMRAVFETMGVQDIVAKSIGAQNPHNMVKATFQALQECASPRGVAARRGKKISEIVARRGDQAATS